MAKAADRVFPGLDGKTGKRLEKLAIRECFLISDRGGMDTRNNDGEDFLDMAVWTLAKLMEKAYLLGLEDGKKISG